MPNLAEGMRDELRRARKLKEQYLELGPAGHIGAQVMEVAIREAEDAQANGEVIAMMVAYERLTKLE